MDSGSRTVGTVQSALGYKTWVLCIDHGGGISSHSNDFQTSSIWSVLQDVKGAADIEALRSKLQESESALKAQQGTMQAVQQVRLWPRP